MKRYALSQTLEVRFAARGIMLEVQLVPRTLQALPAASPLWPALSLQEAAALGRALIAEAKAAAVVELFRPPDEAASR